MACQRSIRFALACGLAATVSAAAADPPTDAPSAAGWWFDESGRVGILITPCGDKLCGEIDWLRVPLDEHGQIKRDGGNSDKSLRGRPLCGLPMLGGFVAGKPGQWGDGWIYNPEDGDTYRSTMRLEPDGRLRVRGYVGISLFGKSQLWTRPTTELAKCQVPPAP